ncbi:MAG: hypothetical protein KC729_20810, partial [Candidatus Eisenbacteria bacterium]|nr:hypothetical protein [Candidatus Eisenbacteria bacterium]
MRWFRGQRKRDGRSRTADPNRSTRHGAPGEAGPTHAAGPADARSDANPLLDFSDEEDAPEG